MRRTYLLALSVALIGGALLAPGAQAGKGKGKDLVLYLRWDGPECGATYLSPEDAPDDGNSCAFTFQAAQEVLTAAGSGPLTHDWPASLKKPVKLGSGSVRGAFVVRAYAAAATTLVVELSAITKKGSTDIGTFTSGLINTYITSPVPVDFEIEVPKGLVGKKVESFMLSTTFRGVSAQSYIELDTPAATLTFPLK